MRRPLAALALCLSAALPAAAQGPAAPAEGVIGVGLIEGWGRPDGSRLAAVEIRLAPGWHTYWRAPGAAGIPPAFDWSASRNLDTVAYEWPRPIVFERFGARMIGYSGALVLPVVLTPEQPGRPLELSLDLFFGVCSDICIPAQARVDARLEPDAPTEGRDRIRAALAERAQTPAEAGVVRVACRLAPGAEGPEITAEITFADDPGPGQTAVLEAGDPEVWIGLPETTTGGRTVVARARVAQAGNGGPVIDRRDLRLTVLDARRAVDIPGCAGDG